MSTNEKKEQSPATSTTLNAHTADQVSPTATAPSTDSGSTVSVPSMSVPQISSSPEQTQAQAQHGQGHSQGQGHDMRQGSGSDTGADTGLSASSIMCANNYSSAPRSLNERFEAHARAASNAANAASAAAAEFHQKHADLYDDEEEKAKSSHCRARAFLQEQGNTVLPPEERKRIDSIPPFDPNGAEFADNGAYNREQMATQSQAQYQSQSQSQAQYQTQQQSTERDRERTPDLPSSTGTEPRGQSAHMRAQNSTLSRLGLHELDSQSGEPMISSGGNDIMAAIHYLRVHEALDGQARSGSGNANGSGSSGSGNGNGNAFAAYSSAARAGSETSSLSHSDNAAKHVQVISSSTHTATASDSATAAAAAAASASASTSTTSASTMVAAQDEAPITEPMAATTSDNELALLQRLINLVSSNEGQAASLHKDEIDKRDLSDLGELRGGKHSRKAVDQVTVEETIQKRIEEVSAWCDNCKNTVTDEHSEAFAEHIKAPCLPLKHEIEMLKGLMRGLHNLEQSIHILLTTLGYGLMLHAVGPNFKRKILWANKALYDMYGYNYAELDKITSNASNPQVIHPADVERFFNEFNTYAEAHQRRYQERTQQTQAQQASACTGTSASASASTAAGADADDAATGAAAAATGAAKNNDTQLYTVDSTVDDTIDFEYRLLNGKTQNYVWFKLRGAYVGRYQGMSLYLCLINDITREKKLQDRIERWVRKSAMLSEASQELVFEYDYNTDEMEHFGNYQQYVADSQRKSHGFLNQLPLKENIHPADKHILSSLLRDTSLARENKRRTVKFRMSEVGGGEYLWHSCSAIGYTEESTDHIKIIGKIYNIHQYESRIASLHFENQRDPMTKLLNKVTMEQLCRNTLSERSYERHALLMIDIDNFKQVNDTKGHAFGDEVIKMVAHCLNNAFRSSDLVARTGGDEFVVMLKNVNFDQAVALAEVYLKVLNKQREMLSQPYPITNSIGIAFYPDDAATYEDLYNAADSALYVVKRNIKGAIAIFGESNHLNITTPSHIPPLNREDERLQHTFDKIAEEKRQYDKAEAEAQAAVERENASRGGVYFVDNETDDTTNYYY